MAEKFNQIPPWIRYGLVGSITGLVAGVVWFDLALPGYLFFFSISFAGGSYFGATRKDYGWALIGGLSALALAGMCVLLAIPFLLQ